MKFKSLLFMTALTVVGCTGKPVSEAGGDPAAKKDINIQLYSVRDKILPDYSNLDSLRITTRESSTGVRPRSSGKLWRRPE